jgi:hypothetical protein
MSNDQIPMTNQCPNPKSQLSLVIPNGMRNLNQGLDPSLRPASPERSEVSQDDGQQIGSFDIWI